MPSRPDAQVKQFRHRSPSVDKGFTSIPNPVMFNTKLSPQARLLYGYMAHLAWMVSDPRVDVTLQQMADEIGISTRALHGYLKELKDEGLVESFRRGMGLSNAYIINEPIVPNGVAESATQDGRSSHSSRGRDPFQEPIETLEPERGAAHPAAPARPADRPKEVNGEPVTDEEYHFAHNIVAHFNRVAGTKYTGKESVAKVIRRVREHPEVTLSQHRQVIERAFASPWWKDAPDPRVVYGNATQFEKSLHSVAVAPAKRALTPEEIGSYGETWGPGTSYASPDEARRPELEEGVIEGEAVEVE